MSTSDNNDVLARLDEVLEERKNAAADSSYVASLYAKGLDTILKKIGEEAAETIIAGKAEDKEQIIYETADLWFHTMVLLSQQGIKSQQIIDELGRRFGLSGIDEKASRSNKT